MSSNVRYLLTRKPTPLERQYGREGPITATAPYLPDVGMMKMLKWQGVWWSVKGVGTVVEED